MTEFVGTAWEPASPDIAALATVCATSLEARGRIEHVFTHFALTLNVYVGRAVSAEPPPGCRWVAPDALDREPIPTVFLKVWAAARAAPSAVVALDRTARVSKASTDPISKVPARARIARHMPETELVIGSHD